MRWKIVLTLFAVLPVHASSATPGPAGKDERGNEEELIAALVAALDDQDYEVRKNIASALGNLGEVAVPRLINALGHAKKERRMGAAMALGQVRPQASAAIPALLKLLKDADEGVRRDASYALSRIVVRSSSSVTPVNNYQLKAPKLDPVPAEPIPGGDR